MSYETKVILIALGEIVSNADSIEDIYEAIAKMANAEGLMLEPLEILRKKKEEKLKRQLPQTL